MPDPTMLPIPGSPEERTRFAQLQRRLADQFTSFSADPTQSYTAVVVPSQSFDPVELAKIPGVAHYEERSLFNLMLLRRPRMNVIYVTSKRLNPLVVDYYLHQMRGVPPHHARARLLLFDCDDGSSRPLTMKILERPLLLERIRRAIPNPSAAHMVVFNATPLERTLSVQLGISLNACDPQLSHLGSKTGSRQVFREAGVALAPGRDGLRDTRDLVEGLAETWEQRPDARRMVVKLDESFSGEGNAILELEPLAGVAPGNASASARRQLLRERLPDLRLEAAGRTWDDYKSQFDKQGGVCELWLEGEGKTSPSVQMRINPMRSPQVISSHDQVMGGPSGQVFMGCTFPAADAYRTRIQSLARRVGRVMADRGVVGRFGVDFLVIPRAEGEDEVVAVEINLRQGGTTHPFNTMKFLTDGRFDPDSGRFYTTQGRERAYFATDTLSAPEYRGLLPYDLLDALVMNGSHFRPDETGVVVHLLGCLSEHGKLGCTAVAETVPQAEALYGQVVKVLDRLTGRAAQG